MRATFVRLLSLVTIATFLTTAWSSSAVESHIGRAFQNFDPSSVQRRDNAAILEAANALIDSLDPERKEVMVLPFDTPEKKVWSNLPPNPEYAGLRLADLSETQLEAAVDFIATSLSPVGFDKVRGILQGDDLLVREDSAPRRGNMLFGADNYWLFFFGAPSASKPWGWQLDGHHLALNITIVGERLTMSPSFIGTQPYHVRWADEPETRPMSGETRKAYQLVTSLDSAQRKAAIQGPRRQNLDAGPGDDDVTPALVGIAGADLTIPQRDQLVDLVEEWLAYMPEAQAAARLHAIRATLNETHFAWWGEPAVDAPIYFRIQGPNALVEFCHQNLGGNPLEHLHSVYRDPSNDYGAAWLAESN